jgi:hypothetical protein
VRRHVRPEACVLNSVDKCLFHGFHRLAVPFDNEALSAPFPPAQMGQQLGRHRDRRLALARLARSRRTPE